MSAPMSPRIALLWNKAEDERKARRQRLDGVFQALTALGAVAEPVVYDDEIAAGVRERLLRTDGVLVWVNPITAGGDRVVLDALLRDVAAAGVWVSAHPDAVAALGTKEVLHRTRSLGWGSDVRVYDDIATLRSNLPSRLATSAIVIKRARGNAGIGVWKVELIAPTVAPTLASVVHVEHAYDGHAEEAPLGAFIEGFEGYLEGGGRLIEQPFLARVAEGMVRCYLSGTSVAGFAEHVPRGFVPTPPDAAMPVTDIPALGFGKVMHEPEHPAFARLRTALESEWIPGMRRLLGLSAESLPAIWDADFLRGDTLTRGCEDPWVLCEINASCVSPFPDSAAGMIARTAYERVVERWRAGR